ncbi:MAG: UvrD-helicase domain-containing protein, partial [Brachymonas sp.]|nr:UvrD-helicase domain-containing protein [Brachymonas sp.]
MSVDDFFSPSFAGAAQADDWLRGLNDEQRSAVMLPDEHALILAGAGSGKTRVLTTRIAWLLAQQRVSPGGIMAVTFT